MRAAPIWLIGALASCSSVDPIVEPATFGSLELSIPAGWRSRDASRPGAAIATWTPDDNANRESVVLVQTRSLPAISDGGHETVQRFLDQALDGLPGAAFGPAVPLRTKHGLLGVSAEGTFTPRGQDRPYRRLHAVMFEGTTLVHVIFTAGVADASSEAFQVVVDSLHRKEG